MNINEVSFFIMRYFVDRGLKLHLTFGGMCMLPQHRGGACFCTRGEMQDYDVVLFIIALAKTVTPAGGPRREPGRAVAPATKPPL
jgi:hypothetical protein